MGEDSVADLRSFLERVRKERPSDLLEIEREVDPKHETTAIVVKLEERQRSPSERLCALSDDPPRWVAR